MNINNTKRYIYVIDLLLKANILLSKTTLHTFNSVMSQNIINEKTEFIIN